MPFTMRICEICSNEFSFNRPKNVCGPACALERARLRAREWNKLNPELVIARVAAWKASNPDRVKFYKGTARHRATRGRIDRKYRENNKDQLNRRQLKFISSNRELIAVRNKNVKAHMRGAMGSFSLGEWNLLVILFGYRCAYCWEVPSRLEADHAVPIARGGSNLIENILPSCHRCNQRKSDRIVVMVSDNPMDDSYSHAS